MPLPRKLQRCVVFFGVAIDRSQSLPQDQSSFVGTGFVVSLPVLGRRFAHNYLVTNAHVATYLQSQPAAFVRVNLQSGGSESIWLDGQTWTRHPRVSVDIALLRPDFRRFPAWRNLAIDAVSRDEFLPVNMLDSVRLGVGDPIHVPGLLSNTPGVLSNMPLVRSGTLAALAADPVELTADVFESVHLGVILSVGGMSGSPTFIEDRPSRSVAFSGTERPWGYLLGVNAGHFNDAIDGTSACKSAHTANAGVNIIHPVEGLNEILDLPEVVAERAAFEVALQHAFPELFEGGD